MSRCYNCNKEIKKGIGIKFCCRKCRRTYHKHNKRFAYAEGYDPYLALWVAVLLPENRTCNDYKLNVTPEMLSKVGHTLLERITTQIDREGAFSYFKKVFTLEGRNETKKTNS